LPTILALIFAGVAAVIAARSLVIQTIEHRRLRAELVKRADFEITVRPVGSAYTEIRPDSAALATAAETVHLRFEIGLRNVGQRAATHTVLNVLAAQRYSGLTWTLPNGGAVDSRPVLAHTSETLEEDGQESVCISDEIERVALRTPRLRHVAFTALVPREGTLPVRLRVKAQSDDLPDDVEEHVKDYVVNITRGI
jgi:hypothetical protein